jgi:putative SOS response-associated peptidase YedK
MCGRYVLSKRKEKYMAKLYPDWNQVVTEERPPTWNLAPTAPAWIIREMNAAPHVSLCMGYCFFDGKGARKTTKKLEAGL